MGHIRETQTEALVIGAYERIDALQIYVITNHYQAALRIVAIDAAGGVGNDHRFDADAREDADWERDFFRGIAFIEVDAALHRGDGDVADVADDETSGVAYGGGLGKIRNFRVGNFRCVAKFVSEIAESRAQDQSNAWPQLGFGEDEFRGAVSA